MNILYSLLSSSWINYGHLIAVIYYLLNVHNIPSSRQPELLRATKIERNSKQRPDDEAVLARKKEAVRGYLSNRTEYP